MKIAIPLEKEKIKDFCRRWKISEFSLFGSVLREDFRPDSDVDVLVTFAPGSRITFSNRVDMLDELAAIFGREVDLVEKDLIRNPFRRHEILKTKEVIYAA
jgi:predicted nucleotidyltransferase